MEENLHRVFFSPYDRAACQEWLIVLSVMCLVSAVPILLAVRDLHKFLGLLGCPVGITLIILVVPPLSHSPHLCTRFLLFQCMVTFYSSGCGFRDFQSHTALFCVYLGPLLPTAAQILLFISGCSLVNLRKEFSSCLYLHPPTLF